MVPEERGHVEVQLVLTSTNRIANTSTNTSTNTIANPEAAERRGRVKVQLVCFLDNFAAIAPPPLSSTHCHDQTIHALNYNGTM